MINECISKEEILSTLISIDELIEDSIEKEKNLTYYETGLINGKIRMLIKLLEEDIKR